MSIHHTGTFLSNSWSPGQSEPAGDFFNGLFNDIRQKDDMFLSSSLLESDEQFSQQ